MTANADMQVVKVEKGQGDISAGWTIVQMILICAVAILLNFFPERVGVIVSATDPSSFVPILAREFQDNLPWLNLLWTLQFNLCAVNLILRRWTTVTRWADCALDVLAVCVLARLVLGGPISVFPWATVLIKLGLAIALIVTGAAAIARLVRLLGEPRAEA